MRLQLAKLQELDDKTQKMRAKGLKNQYEEVDGVLHHQRLPFIPEAIQTELISQEHHDSLERHFSVNKTKDLISQKYYWLGFQKDIETYIKDCDVCLGLKAVKYKPYGDLQSLLVSNH